MTPPTKLPDVHPDFDHRRSTAGRGGKASVVRHEVEGAEDEGSAALTYVENLPVDLGCAIGVKPEDHAEIPAEIHDIIAGEHRHAILQALHRGAVRRSVGEGCAPCRAWVIGSAKSGITKGLLRDIFPGATVEGWAAGGRADRRTKVKLARGLPGGALQAGPAGPVQGASGGRRGQGPADLPPEDPAASRVPPQAPADGHREVGRGAAMTCFRLHTDVCRDAFQA
jgi:hypothetical protein